MRAAGVPQAAQGGVTTIGLAMRAWILASCSRSQARARGVLACVLAYLVEADFDGFPVQDAVAAADAFPRADGAQFHSGDGGLDAQAVQVLEVIVGHVPGVATASGVGGGLDLKVVGGPGKHALLAVKGVLGRHADEAGRSRSSSSSAVSLIGCDRGGSRDASWQTPS